MKPLVNERNLEHIVVLILLLLACTTLLTSFYAIDNFDYKIWGDREISRSALLSQYFMVDGAELNGRFGTRAPGGLLHYISYGLLSIDPSPKFVHWAFSVGLLSSSLYLAFVAWKISGAVSACITVCVLLTSSTTLTNLSRIWNPSFGAPFVILAMALFVLFLVERRQRQFVGAIALLIAAAQMQMAAFFAIAMIVLYLVIFRIKIDLSSIFAAVGITVLLYLPWILNQTIGWPPTPEILPDVSTAFVAHTSDASNKIFAFSDQFSIVDGVKALMSKAYLFSTFGEIRVFRLGAPLALGAFLLCSATYFLLATRRVSGVDDFRIHLGNVLIFALFVMGGTALVFELVISLLGNLGVGKQRYFIFVTPVAALASGICISLLFKSAITKRPSIWIGALLVLSVLILLTRIAVITNFHFQRADLSLGEAPDYDDLVIISKDINRKTGLGSEAIMERVGYFVFKSGQFSPLETPTNYILDYLNLKSRDDAYQGCLFVIDKKDIDTLTLVTHKAAADGLATHVLNRLQLDHARVISLPQPVVISEDAKYYLLGVPTTAAGCPKSYMNPYIPTAAELLIAKTFRATSDDLVFDDENNRIFVRDVSDKTKFPILMMLEFTSDRDGTRYVTLHSNQLRSRSALLNGYYETRSIKDPQVELKNRETGAIISQYIYEGELGATVFSTPWTSKFDELPPGSYDVEFFYNLGGTKRYNLPKPFVVRPPAN